ncbi:ureidoglycolate hydrolase [Metarhizium guizhouense ARSEF 977]|uniref:Ureidoglycolate hydrolase n=1 Tax=Metarhizium guizhouense (strain ARSEF 977) TaxID=1276136 RepID=A0A0B4GWW9_METGA|nr:ureidoglycolate hydrolase [Metarhizium guizhouense ARSEF 977]
MGVENDASSRLDNLSAASLQPGENPYSALINACHDDPAEIQLLYSAHRTRRNAEQREKFLAPDFAGLSIDQTLLRLERPHVEPGFKDERNCLVFWARPPDHVVRLAAKLQHLLRRAAPGIWLMPTHRMHMTTLEVAFSKTAAEMGALVSALRPSIPGIASYTRLHRARVVKPMVSYDTSAFAVSFLPASGEEALSPAPTRPDAPAESVVQGDGYTYHHLRRDVFGKICEAGVQVGSRYQVPSAHVTLGRFLDEADHDTPEKRAAWVAAVDDVNAWLEREVWDRKDAEYIGEWVVGHEKGLDARTGTLWYGGGRTILLGEGF